MEEKQKSSKGLKLLLGFLVLVLIILCGIGYYGYNEYKSLKDDNKKLEEKLNSLENEVKKSKEENTSTIDNNNTSNEQNVNYKVEGNKHIYDSDEYVSVYALNGVMYSSWVTDFEGHVDERKLNINESDVNMAIANYNPQAPVAYIVKKDGSVVKYYNDGVNFEKQDAFKNYKVRSLTINCKGGESGSCSIRTYTITLFDGSNKTVETDE